MSYASSEEESRRVVHAFGGQGCQRCSWSTHHGRSVSRTKRSQRRNFPQTAEMAGSCYPKGQIAFGTKDFLSWSGREIPFRSHSFVSIYTGQTIWLRLWDR